eukprot:m.260971 g.260971  ORF g.260971 m.260971 type:complete len:53 (+) comp26780_c1_seq18:209-367(+)
MSGYCTVVMRHGFCFIFVTHADALFTLSLRISDNINSTTMLRCRSQLKERPL